MTKNEKETLKEIFEKINHIVNWDNKNLKQKQYYDLSDCLDGLTKILKIEEN